MPHPKGRSDTMRNGGRAFLWLPALLLGPCLAAALSPGLSASVRPMTTANVTTSRGDYDLMIYPPREGHDHPPVLMISGEGGWRRFDSLLASFFADAGFWVGGIDSIKY